MTAKAPPAGGPRMFHFSTDAFAERERLSAWRDAVGRSVINVDIEPTNPETFRAEATAYLMPGLAVLFAFSDAHKCHHPRELIRDDDLSFLVAPACHFTASQLGRTTDMAPRDSVMMSNEDVGSVAVAAGTQFMSFSVPRATIRPLVPDLGAVIARPISPDNPAFKLLMGYLGNAKDVQALQTPELQQLVASHVHDLLAVALGATRDAAEIAQGRGVRAARRAAAKTFVREQLRRPDLRANTVAAHLGVTPRYVQMLFETENQSFSEFVLTERLGRAHRMLLTDPALSVSAIALAAGFNDLSYFNRTFRRRYGRTPTEVRAEAPRAPDSA
jgi:AraC-like DNA-binding protein